MGTPIKSSTKRIGLEVVDGLRSTPLSSFARQGAFGRVEGPIHVNQPISTLQIARSSHRPPIGANGPRPASSWRDDDDNPQREPVYGQHPNGHPGAER